MIKQKHEIAYPNDRRLLLISLILTMTYLAIGLLLPSFPYENGDKVLYPVFVLYKSSPLFHMMCTSLLLFTTAFFGVRNIRNGIRVATVTMLISLVITCGIVFSVLLINRFTQINYRHDDTLTFQANVYHAGTSSGMVLDCCKSRDYHLFECDSFGLICEIIDSYYPSRKPDEAPQARFVQPENDGWIYLSLGDQYVFPLFCNARDEIKCGSVE